MARAAAGSVELVGRLEHNQVAELFPRAEVSVMPSTFPEAFGMVAAEAAACGVLPVSAAHSGLAEVSEALARSVPEEVARLLSFPVDDGAPKNTGEPPRDDRAEFEEWKRRRDSYRAQREAWRAQREEWRNRRDEWKAHWKAQGRAWRDSPQFMSMSDGS